MFVVVLRRESGHVVGVNPLPRSPGLLPKRTDKTSVTNIPGEEGMIRNTAPGTRPPGADQPDVAAPLIDARKSGAQLTWARPLRDQPRGPSRQPAPSDREKLWSGY